MGPVRDAVVVIRVPSIKGIGQGLDTRPQNSFLDEETGKRDWLVAIIVLWPSHGVKWSGKWARSDDAAAAAAG